MQCASVQGAIIIEYSKIEYPEKTSFQLVVGNIQSGVASLKTSKFELDVSYSKSGEVTQRFTSDGVRVNDIGRELIIVKSITAGGYLT